MNGRAWQECLFWIVLCRPFYVAVVYHRHGVVFVLSPVINAPSPYGLIVSEISHQDATAGECDLSAWLLGSESAIGQFDFNVNKGA